MELLDNKELDMRIESFIARKHQQYPELALRDNKKQRKSTSDFIADKISGFATGLKLMKFAH